MQEKLYMDDILIGQERNVDEAAMMQDEVVSSAPARCLNCGETLADGVRYCPMCGQPAATGRLETKDLFINSLGTISRINKGVLHTCLNLLWRPWKVIAGYIHGQRLVYTDPVKLLIGLCFIAIVLEALLNLESVHKEAYTIADIGGDSAYGRIFNFFADSATLQYLIAFLPVVPVMMFLNRKNKKFHYNFAECSVGALYMSDGMLLVNLLCLPLLALGIDIETPAIFLYEMIMGVVVVYKAFGHYNLTRKRRVRRVIGAVMLIAASYMLIILVIATLIVIVVALYGKSLEALAQ